MFFLVGIQLSLPPHNSSKMDRIKPNSAIKKTTQIASYSSPDNKFLLSAFSQCERIKHCHHSLLIFPCQRQFTESKHQMQGRRLRLPIGGLHVVDFWYGAAKFDHAEKAPWAGSGLGLGRRLRLPIGGLHVVDFWLWIYVVIYNYLYQFKTFLRNFNWFLIKYEIKTNWI